MKLTKEEQKKEARKHIEKLFSLAEKEFDNDIILSNRYIELALKIRDKIKVKLKKEEKIHYCKKCKSYLKPGKNCTIRTKNKYILIHCNNCNAIRKFKICPHDKEKN